MFVNTFIFINNPFINAFTESDILGKLIFLSLYSLSIISWLIIVNKFKQTKTSKKNSSLFLNSFRQQRLNPLKIEFEFTDGQKKLNPFLDIYKVLKKHSLELLARNRYLKKSDEEMAATLSSNDIEFIATLLATQVSAEIKELEKSLYFLSTTVSLAPFLGLLGTVWGILMTFTNMQTQLVSNSQQMVLSGLSLALATTVLGLLVAIPALIGYNYLKNYIQTFSTDMEAYSNEILASVELQYRAVEK